MKKVFSIVFMVLIFCAGFSSCKKSSSTPQSITKPQPKMQYYANGVLVNCDAIADVNLGWIGYPYINSSTSRQLRIDLHGSNHQRDDGINLGLCNNCGSVITLGQYPINTVGSKSIDCKIQSFFYNNGPPHNAGDYTVNVTLIQNGLASGSFSGILLPYYSGDPVMNITNGTFSNIPTNIP